MNTTTRTKRRRIGGVWFRCLSPGSWLSDDGRLALVLMMKGTPYEQWELYLTEVGTGNSDKVPDDPDSAAFLCDDFVCYSITFNGTALAKDIQALTPLQSLDSESTVTKV